MHQDICTRYRHKETGTLVKMTLIDKNFLENNLLEKNPRYVFIVPLYSEYLDLTETERLDYGIISRKRFDKEYEKVEQKGKKVMQFLKNEDRSEMEWQIDENKSEGYNQKKLEEFFIEILEKGEVTFKYTMGQLTFKDDIDYIEFWINHQCYSILEGGRIIFNPIGRFTISSEHIDNFYIIKVAKKEEKVAEYRKVVKISKKLYYLLERSLSELENERD